MGVMKNTRTCKPVVAQWDVQGWLGYGPGGKAALLTARQNNESEQTGHFTFATAFRELRSLVDAVLVCVLPVWFGRRRSLAFDCQFDTTIVCDFGRLFCHLVGSLTLK